MPSSPPPPQVGELGCKSWVLTAKQLGSGRTGKQCRERWLNHLRPDLNKGPWTAEEDAALVEAHRAVGNRWSEIARRLPGRPENAIKNRWNSTVRARGRRSGASREPDSSGGVAPETTPPKKAAGKSPPPKQGSPSADETEGSGHAEGSPLRAYIREIMGDAPAASARPAAGGGVRAAGGRGGVQRARPLAQGPSQAGRTDGTPGGRGGAGAPPDRRAGRGRPRKRAAATPLPAGEPADGAFRGGGAQPPSAKRPRYASAKGGGSQEEGSAPRAPPPGAAPWGRAEAACDEAAEDEAVLIVPDGHAGRGALLYSPEGGFSDEAHQAHGGGGSSSGDDATASLGAELWAVGVTAAEGADRTPPRPRHLPPAGGRFLELLQSPTRGLTLMPLAAAPEGDLPMLDLNHLQPRGGGAAGAGLGGSDSDEAVREGSPPQLRGAAERAPRGERQEAPVRRALMAAPSPGDESLSSGGVNEGDTLEVTEGALDVGECVQGVSCGAPAYNEVASAVACANGTLFQYDGGFLGPGLGMAVQPSVVRQRMVQVAREMRARWDLGRVAIAFRYSRVEYNDPYLCIAASARVWALAREAVQFARDRLAPGAAQYHQLFNQQLHGGGAGGEPSLLDLVS